LPHPDRQDKAEGAVHDLQYSRDGKLLIGGGYPSGVVQVWDAATHKQVRVFETGRGYRGSSTYFTISPDERTMYVTWNRQKSVRVEKDGKRTLRREVSGEIRRWDFTAGKPLPPLKATPSRGVFWWATVSPDGNILVALEQGPDEKAPDGLRDAMYAWDIKRETSRWLLDGEGHGTFSPDGKLLFVAILYPQPSTLHLFDTASWKEIARWETSAKSLRFGGLESTPDGRTIVVTESAHPDVAKGAKPSIKLFDVASRSFVATFTIDVPGTWLREAKLTPDGKRLVAIDHLKNHLFVWEVASSRIVIQKSLGEKAGPRHLALSPDSRHLAVVSQYVPEELRHSRDDLPPTDLEQPRIFLFDLTADSPLEVLIAPQGFVGGLTFSPDSQTLALGGTGAVHLFDVRPQQKPR
jgi:WD40 repeat protein